MTDKTNTTIKPLPPIWEYVSAAEFTVPSPPITSAVRGGVAGLWQRLKPEKNELKAPLKTEEQLKELSNSDLGCVASDPDWRTAAISLKAKLANWIDAKPKRMPAVVVIGQPHSGHQEIIDAIAAEQNLRILSAPSTEQILSSAHDWLNQTENSATPWVLPNLEKCYLRHPSGLNTIRQFFDKLHSGLLGRGIIGCDSWAWAYLKHVVRGGLPDALVAQAFDNGRLSRWLRALAGGSEGQEVAFRQTNNGTPVLSPSFEPIEDNAASDQTTNFVANLAAFCRGIPGVALSVWRQSLRSEPDEALLGQDTEDEKCRFQTTVWVVPWEKIKHPALNADIGVDSSMVLHNLLLHNGLSSEILADIMSVSPSSVLQTILMLEEGGIIESHENLWQVCASSYPVVRQFLDGEGYLTDLL